MKSLRSLFRHIRDGFRNLFRNSWMTLVAIFTMILTLFMVGSLLLMMNNVEKITQDIEEGVKIRVHIDIAAGKEEEAALKDQIASLKEVVDISYRTKDEELEDLTATIEEFELVFGDNNPLRNVFLVSVDDSANLEEVTQQIRQFPYAVEVNYGEIDADNLLKMLDLVRIIVAVIAAVLIMIAIALISNTIKLTIYARQNEIEIMKLVGAKNTYIKAPFIIEGALIGIVGSIIASLLVYAFYEGAQKAPLEWNAIRFLKLTPTFPMIYIITILLIMIGIVLGMVGAQRSIKKIL